MGMSEWSPVGREVGNGQPLSQGWGAGGGGLGVGGSALWSTNSALHDCAPTITIIESQGKPEKMDF